jgi:hypothetical protein
VTDLCTIADVEALLGYPIPATQTDRVEALIGMASGVVGAAVVLPSGEVPRAVAYVTASMVVRTMANPGQLSSEAIGTYHAGYAAGNMALSEADKETLRPWLITPDGAYSVCTPLAPPCGSVFTAPPFDWERDLDPEGIDA